MKSIWRKLIIALVSICAAITLVGLWYDSQAQLRETYQSPDGKFKIELYAYKQLTAMPGQGSDGPGKIKLVTDDGVTVDQVTLPMVQLMTKPEWTKTKVVVPRWAEWDLPQEQN